MDDVLLAKFKPLISKYRDTCLWFLRDNVYPTSPKNALDILKLIEKHGDMEAFSEARELRKWLSQNFNETSVS